MKNFLISLIFLVVCTLPCHAYSYSKQMLKANKALLALEKNQKATKEDQQKVVDMLEAVINSTTDMIEKCEASIELAECYSENVVVQIRDYAKAKELYKKALELVCSNYADNGTEPIDEVKGLKWRAYYNTGYYYYYKRTPTQDLSKALEYYTEAANYAPRFHRAVGEFYEFGLGCDIDPEKALMHYTESLYSGADSYAKYYSTEYFVDKVSSDGLDTLAFNNFREGLLLLKMSGEQIDYDKVKQHLTTAAERGYVPAQYELGTLYKNGSFPEGKTPESFQLATEWLKKAADTGYLPALHNLAILCETGEKGLSTSKGQEAALPYYERAAYEGFPPSQCALAVYYYMGYAGKTKDNDAAKFWLELSAETGYKTAQQYLDNLLAEEEKKQQQAEEKANVNENVLASLVNSLNNLSYSLNNLGNTINSTISKQNRMTPSQTNRMSKSSYQSGASNRTKGNGNSSNVDNSDELMKKSFERRKKNILYSNLRYDREMYLSWESDVRKMAQGRTEFNKRNLEKYQDHMRSIRERCERNGVWGNYGVSEWENWSGK